MAGTVPAISQVSGHRDGDQDPRATMHDGINHTGDVLQHIADRSNHIANQNKSEHRQLNLLVTIPVRLAGEQSQQRSEQDAPAQEAAMMPVMMPMMAVAAMATNRCSCPSSIRNDNLPNPLFPDQYAKRLSLASRFAAWILHDLLFWHQDVF